MSVKHIGLSALIVALCSLGRVYAQGPTSSPGDPDVLPLYTLNNADTSTPYSPSTPSSAAPPVAGGSTFAAPNGGSVPTQAPPIMLGPPASSWLLYPRPPGCCGPVDGCGGPIGSEIFVRSGIAFPVGGGVFGNFLTPGWDIEVGGRVLFFNHDVDKAWTVSLSVSNIYNGTGNANNPVNLFNVPVKTAVTLPGSVTPTPATITVPQLQATVSSYNQTFVNLGFGREWYLLGSADPGQQTGCNWRWGVDAGGRYGTSIVRFNEINHHTDVVGGLYCAIHSDVEVPWRCGILQAGIRYEYNYIWGDPLQSQNNGDYQSMNLLFQIGARF